MPDPLPSTSPPRPRRPLFRKYFAFLFLLVAGSLAINGTVEMYSGYREHREALMRLQRQRAQTAALQIEAFVDDIVRALVLTSQSPEVQLEGITPRFRRSLFILLRNHPAIMETTVFDQNGRRSLRHSRLRSTASQDREDHSTLPPFSIAIAGETYFSPVYFNFDSEPFLTVAVPIRDLEGRTLGVISAEVDLKYIRDVVSEIRIGEAGFAYVVERGGDLIAHPDLALVLQKKNLNAIPQVRDFMDVLRAPGTPAGPQSVLGRNSRGEKVLSSYTIIPQLGWGVFVEQPLREAFDPLYSSLMRTGAILLSVLLLALLMAFTLTRAIVRPIEALKRGVSRIGQGHLAEPIDVQTADEIGDLATAFNEMASAVLSSRQKLEEHSRTLEQRVAARTRQLSTLLETARYAVSTLTQDEIFPMILQSAAKLLDCQASTFRLLDPETKMLRVAADYNLLDEEFKGRGDIALGEGCMGRVALEGQPMTVEDVETDPFYHHKEKALRAGIRSIAIVPVRVHGAVTGVLSVYDRKRRRFSDEEVSSLTEFANLASLALEKTRLYGEILKGKEHLGTILEINKKIGTTIQVSELLQTIADEAARLLQVDGVGFRLVEGEFLVTRALTGTARDVMLNPRLKIGESLSGQAAAENRAIIVPDIATAASWRKEHREAALRAGVTSVMVVPVRISDRVIGILTIHAKARRQFTQRDVDLLTSFADQAAIAIENARLYAEAQRRNQELQALFTVTNTVTRSLDIASITQAALLTTIEVLHVDAGRLYIFDEKSHVLHLTAHHGLPPEVLKDYASYAPGQGIIGRVFQESRPIVFSDVAADANYAAMARSGQGKLLGFRSAAGLPILAQGRPVGVIYVLGRAVREFTPEDLALLSAIGGQIGIAIENARLYQNLEGYSRNLEERVRERTQELEIANQHKSEFLATMSHELRTPLNAVIGFSELLTSQLGANLSDRHKRYLKNIHVSGHHLLDLINGILDLAKVESGKMDLQYEEVPFPELIQQVLAGVQPQAEAKALTLSREIEGGLERVTLDAGKVKQILYNLLGNAVKFTPDGGQVTVTARVAPGSRQRDCLEIAVTDTGIGIKPEDQGRIFEPFQQIESTLARKYPGTGLGLALTKQLVELHGGQIKVESTPGRGSTFTFTLALPSPVALPREAGEASAETPGVEQSEERGEDDPDRPLILVVEDDPKAIDLLSTYLREGGYRVVIARGSQEALTKARALRPLALTLDILFPTEDGWQILQNLKEDPETRDLPVIIVSIVDDRPRGLQMGAVDYLVKPLTREPLLAGLARLGIASPRLRGMQVLAIDDDPGVLELLGATLEGEGLSLLGATEGPEGIRLARTKRPDLIILDLMMPGMSGFEVVQRLRTDPATAGIPIFICSGKTLTAQERELLAKQVEGVIQKGSFLPKDILQMIAEVRTRLRPAPSSR